jgi:hypothetical protein
MSSTVVTSIPRDTSSATAVSFLPARLVGAGLALAVAYIHVKDQGGIIGDKTPSYVGVGYWVLEIVAVLTAVALVAGAGRRTVQAWWLAAGVAVGPLAGFALSRGPGLPSYTDDRGNWTETLGLVSVAVELTLLLLAAVALARHYRHRV